jgi:hypothetical protein
LSGTIGLVPNAPSYPFTPKSNRHLAPGQFWAIPLSDGRFGCGRVMAVPGFGPTDRIGFFAGLMDWVRSDPPTYDSLAGVHVAAQAKTGFEAIANTGGSILGLRPLELDGLLAIIPGYEVGSVHRVWGWHAIVDEAERLAAR